ncbi:MAG TPA: type II secretion system F family protein [Myxococcales bacterium]|nr:type II secretion system F family protein [Myxococcales bacterium]
MSAPAPQILSVLAPLLTAAFAATAFLAASRLYARSSVQPERQHARRSSERGALAIVRSAIIARLAARNEIWMPRLRLAQLDGWLRKAGRPLELTAGEVVALMEIAAVLFFAGGVALSWWLRLGFAAWSLGLVGGAAYPLLWLRDRMRLRQRAIVRGLPYGIDLLTLAVEAGLDFTAALAKVVEKGPKGPLAEELSVAIRELRMGKTREDALRQLARRVDLPPLTSFVQALVQADRMGTPLGKVLRVLSTQMRNERTQRAEKLANEAPVKLVLPLVFFIFPTLFLVLFGPIGYQVFFGGSF